MQLCALAYNRIGTITTLQFVRMRVKEGSHYVIEVERERELPHFTGAFFRVFNGIRFRSTAPVAVGVTTTKAVTIMFSYSHDYSQVTVVRLTSHLNRPIS